MKRMHLMAIAIGLTLAPWAAFSQTPADSPAMTAPAVTEPATIPPDQQPTKEQLATLFEVMRLREQMQSAFNMMPTMVQQRIYTRTKEMASKLSGGKQITLEKRAEIDEIMGKFMKKALTIISVDEIIDDMSSIYQRHLSRTDVDAFIAFYQSPAGQHLLNEQPVIMKEYMPVIMKRAEERSKGLTDELAAEMKHCLDSSTPPLPKSKPEQK